MAETPDTLRAAFRPHDWNEESKYAVAWLRDNVGLPHAAEWEAERVQRHMEAAQFLSQIAAWKGSCEAAEKRLEAAEKYIVALYHGSNDRIDEAWDGLDKETQSRLAKADAALAAGDTDG